MRLNDSVKQGAKHRLRGFMSRNMVAPYEVRSSEVRGNGFVIKQMRLADAKSSPIPSSRRPYTTSNRFRALRRRYARLVPGYHILHHKGAATRSCERPLRHHIIDKRGRCEAPKCGDNINNLFNRGAKHRLRGFMPRNRVANRTKKKYCASSRRAILPSSFNE